MKNILFISSIVLLSSAVYAQDPLNRTSWKTIDDQTHEARSIVKFREDKSGYLTATVQKVLVVDQAEKCTKCTGTFKNKPLVGVTVIRNLKNTGGNEYEGGTIIDPQTGKSYSLKGKLTNNGTRLDLRGYMGISALGRNQTWYKVS